MPANASETPRETGAGTSVDAVSLEELSHLSLDVRVMTWDVPEASDEDRLCIEMLQDGVVVKNATSTFDAERSGGKRVRVLSWYRQEVQRRRFRFGSEDLGVSAIFDLSHFATNAPWSYSQPAVVGADGNVMTMAVQDVEGTAHELVFRISLRKDGEREEAGE